MPELPLHLSDWHRILIGAVPSIFLVEIVERAVLVYLMLLFAMRLMGRRIGAQLTQTELAVVVSLGAAIGVPMQAPDRGMIPALIILAIAIGIQRGLNFLTTRVQRSEQFLQGSVMTLVEDGRLLVDRMHATNLSRERLFAILRGAGLQQLGQVRRVYFESSGQFTIIRLKKAPPGLWVLPQHDKAMHELAKSRDGLLACRICGEVLPGQLEASPGHCPRCRGEEWEEACKAVDENDAN